MKDVLKKNEKLVYSTVGLAVLFLILVAFNYLASLSAQRRDSQRLEETLGMCRAKAQRDDDIVTCRDALIDRAARFVRDGRLDPLADDVGAKLSGRALGELRFDTLAPPFRVSVEPTTALATEALGRNQALLDR